VSNLVIHSTKGTVPGAGAAICRRGHVIKAFIEDPRIKGARCDDCGAKVLVACEVCGYRIRGAASPTAREYSRPSFCDGCGSVFSWTGRRQRIQHLQNVVDELPIDPATRLEVQELLDELLECDAAQSEPGWARILQVAPELWRSTAARAMLATVVPAAVKSRLGLVA
jgi:hypothetical protein